METRWKPIIPQLREFELSLAEDLRCLQIVVGNDKQWSDTRYRKQVSTGIFSDKRGVYLMFDPKGDLQYVGKAMNAFDDNIWAKKHDAYRRWTDLIPFEHRAYFLAPALEFFLISRLDPPRNSQYRGYTIPSRAK